MEAGAEAAMSQLRGHMKEGAAEAEERHNSVQSKLAAKAVAEERRALQHRHTAHGCSAPKSELAGSH